MMLFEKKSSNLLKGIFIGVAVGSALSGGAMLMGNKNLQKGMRKHASNAMHMMKSAWDNMGF